LSQLGRPAVFLDRDGTLNRAFIRDGVSVPPNSEAELEILPGVPEALGSLRRAGFALVVFTNQPDVARGAQTRQVADAINSALRERLDVDDLLCCFHDDADQCVCRKPRPGMLLEAAQRLGLELQSSFAIGDRWRDTEAGRRAGCTTIQIRAEAPPPGQGEPDFWAANLAEAAQIVLGCAQD
jgi:D-glycero-D-manno-heptose 1,7-bisphosphate phosphatase